MKKLLHILNILLLFTDLFAQNSDSLTFDKYNNQHLGLFAPDFRFITTNNTDTSSLYNLQTDSLIILFYDPDCGHCKKEIKKLRKDKKLNKDIALNKVSVISVPPDITMKEWQKSVKRMPKNWINAYSLDNDFIIKKFLWKVPEMFILDKNKRIIYINMYKEEFDDE